MAERIIKTSFRWVSDSTDGVFHCDQKITRRKVEYWKIDKTKRKDRYGTCCQESLRIEGRRNVMG